MKFPLINYAPDDGGAAGGAAGGAEGGAAGGAAGGEPWHTGLDEALVGHVQTKGWDKLTPAEAAREAAKAHREAQSFIGAPAESLVRLPKDAADQAGWTTFRAKLGIPADPSAYKFDGVNGADGKPIAEDFAGFARNLAHKLDLTPERAVSLANEIVKRDADAASSALATKTAALEGERAALKQNWGPNFEANQFIAKQGAARLGVAPEEVAALESVVGYNRVMEMFRKIGVSSGEAAFIGGDGPNPNVMTREQAVNKKAELMADADWTKRYTEGGVNSKEFREMQGLLTIITGDDTEQSRRA